MENGILHVHDLDVEKYVKFREALGGLTDGSVHKVISTITTKKKHNSKINIKRKLEKHSQ